jgi:hypothetical protein
VKTGLCFTLCRFLTHIEINFRFEGSLRYSLNSNPGFVFDILQMLFYGFFLLHLISFKICDLDHCLSEVNLSENRNLLMSQI